MNEATLLRTGDRPILRFERHLPRPIEEVWRAVTEPEQLSAWFPSRIEIDEWKVGARLRHHFDGHDLDPLEGEVLECVPPRRLSFTWGTDTISYSLTPAAGGGTTFVLTEELGAAIAARNAAGWESCLDRLVDGADGGDWRPRFERYVADFEPVLGRQEGPPTGYREPSS
jgi:uncharacterized protein YndB with AHSA1/START domain